MVGSDLEKIMFIFDLNIKTKSGKNFVSLHGQTDTPRHTSGIHLGTLGVPYLNSRCY